ncbi:MAG TPA: hypothetical protein IGS52_25890 [Oscillatoriaceae cyanobacterium M33_DOE_052]|uniref:Uncharacterized protein n=1 Tax=Planktothricoides sp. SpSt-374 TaxID=2282167 RepID=A0A7C3ZWJ3_9CYAN|nr:hypothetical protein [Oscillatoriaceae cyanobacterium M33_DOE_052]
MPAIIDVLLIGFGQEYPSVVKRECSDSRNQVFASPMAERTIGTKQCLVLIQVSRTPRGDDTPGQGGQKRHKMLDYPAAMLFCYGWHPPEASRWLRLP